MFEALTIIIGIILVGIGLIGLASYLLIIYDFIKRHLSAKGS